MKTVKIFNYGAVCLFFLCIILALTSISDKGSMTTLTLAVETGFSVIAAVVVSSFRNLFRFMTRKGYFITTAVLTMGLCAVEIVTVMLTDFKIINDLQYITTAADNFVHGRGLYENVLEIHNDYFETYSNNHFITLIIFTMYKITYMVKGTVSTVLPTAVNIASLSLSYWLMCLCAEEIHEAPRAMICAARGLLFTPFITYAAIFYTDTMSMPYLMLAMYCYLRFRRSRKLYTIIICGGLIAMAYKMKGSSMVLLCAVIIDMLYNKPKFREFIALLTPFAVLCKAISMVSLKVLAIPKSVLYDKEFPLIHWVMMGADGKGDYVLDDFLYTQSYTGKRAKIAADFARLKEKLHAQGIHGFIDHIKAKIQFTWDNPTFMVSKYYDGDFQSDGFRNAAFICYFTLLISIFMGAYFTARGKETSLDIRGEERTDAAFVPRLCLFGLTVFLLIWETRCRYLISMFPIFMLI